jgi:hypothetical protein
MLRSQAGEVLVTPVRAPKANAYAERWVRTARAECLDWLLIVSRGHLEQSFGSMFSITTATVPTGRWGCNRQTRPPGWPSPARMTEALCIDATCSAVSCTSTGELHERVCAPFRRHEPAHDGKLRRRQEHAGEQRRDRQHRVYRHHRHRALGVD